MRDDTEVDENYRDWHLNPRESITELLTELLGFCPKWAREDLSREVDWAQEWLATPVR